MIPVPGDYNGDGAADLAVYEPATGNWLLGCFHKYYRTWTTFNGMLGGPTWMPVPGDYDGDGRNDVCLFEGATGRWVLFTLAGQFLQGTFGWKDACRCRVITMVMAARTWLFTTRIPACGISVA